MTQRAWISISGTQTFRGEEPETIELATQGSYSWEPGRVSLTYTETQLTGLEGVVTSFTVEDGCRVTLQRTGSVNSKMVFVLGEKDESLYDTGFCALLLTVQCTSLTALLNEHGGVLDLEYDIDIEHTSCGTNAYHIQVRTLPQAGGPE